MMEGELPPMTQSPQIEAPPAPSGPPPVLGEAAQEGGAVGVPAEDPITSQPVLETPGAEAVTPDPEASLPGQNPDFSEDMTPEMAKQLKEKMEEIEEERKKTEKPKLTPEMFQENNNAWDRGVEMVLAAYETDPVKVAIQLGKDLSIDGYDPEKDQDVQTAIKSRKEVLKGKEELAKALEIAKKAKETVKAANTAIEEAVEQGKTAVEIEEIKRNYYDETGEVFYILDEDGQPQKTDSVRITQTIKPVMAELEEMAKEEQEGEPTAKAKLAQKTHDVLTDALVTDDNGCHLDREKLAQAERRETLEDAQAFLNTEFARIFLEREIVSPDPTIMTLIQLAKHVDLSHEYARQIVYAGLRLAEQQLKLTPSKAAIQQTKEVLAKHLQKVAAVPVREEEPEAFIRRLAQDDIGFGVDYWTDALNKALQAAEKGEDTSLMMYTLLTDYINAAKQQYARDSGSSSFVKMKEMFESMVPEEKREGLFRVAKIKEEIKTQCPDEYEDFIREEKDGEKALEKKIEQSILFADEDGGMNIFMMLYGLMMLSQIFQSADAEAAAAGAQQQGRGG